MLKTISTQFDTVFRNPKYEAIATLWGFQTIRNALPEYSMSPIEISRRDTNHATVNFLRSLDQVTHAASWKKFLHTDELKKLVQSDQELTLDDAERIQTISGQFKKVEDNPKYSAIAELNGFASTNQNVAKLAKEIVQLKSSPLSNDVPPALANVTFNAKIVRETLDQYQDAHRAWEQTADNSEDAENARKVLMAIKEKHERANQNSNEQMKKLQGLIAQSIKKHQANDRNARGTVKLLDLNDDSDTGNQILSQLVISMRDMNTLRRQQQEAEKQWKKARNQSAEADKANKALMVITRNHEAAKQKSNEQMKMLKLLLNETTSSEDRYSADNAHKTVMLLDDRQQDEDQIVTLLQFSEKSDSQPAEVMLMQFEETPENEPAEVIVMQFQEDENGSGDVVLMQFEEVNGEPQEVVLMQFEDVIEQSNCEDHTTEADKSSSEKDSK
ncbi:MAG: hypothetical protein O2955_14180 [Planctomycetota bacterium]|nr:hypothetical protein [Planctomycetota bacterium]MDA1213660.1 hypothetical protein [Planctomycetota bacterium]